VDLDRGELLVYQGQNSKDRLLPIGPGWRPSCASGSASGPRASVSLAAQAGLPLSPRGVRFAVAAAARRAVEAGTFLPGDVGIRPDSQVVRNVSISLPMESLSRLLPWFASAGPTAD
jgi:hypothetical protein